MKRFQLFTIFLTTFLLFANAESTHPMKKSSNEDQQCKYDKNKSKSYYFMLGGAFVKNDYVNDRLEKLGYREFSPYGLSFGFGGLRRNKRIVRGHEIESIIWKKNEGSNFESTFNVSRFVSLIGFSLLSSERFSLYPLVGIGIGMSSLHAGPKEVAFDSAFALPSQLPPSSPLFQGTFLIDLGLGFQFTHPMPRSKHGKFTIGLRGGYMFDPVDNQRWYRNGVKLSGGPDSDLSGAYLRLTIGKSRGCKCQHAIKKCPHHGAKGNDKCPKAQKNNQ